ncbi:hypothetical protein RRG08_035589 [Elysia crispata]|uniref:Uncharacterized protein n=1 Tax=Elysia crispata TaxID=231223 RepID=A0AAE1B678_9GAST|nr:hypothetical protein RRG08_035589 [Elysia crispata]
MSRVLLLLAVLALLVAIATAKAVGLKPPILPAASQGAWPWLAPPEGKPDSPPYLPMKGNHFPSQTLRQDIDPLSQKNPDVGIYKIVGCSLITKDNMIALKVGYSSGD